MNRFGVCALISAGLGLMVSGCGSNTQVATISVTPTSQSITAGQTAQFSATGTIPHGQHPSTTQDVTSLVTWKSSSTDIVTVNASGVATGVSAGSATITASMAGAASASATVTVTGGGGGSAGDVVSISITPSTQAVNAPPQTAQFIAIGTTASGATVDVTGQAAWNSSSTSVATVNRSGLATGVGKGTSTITAIYTNPDKTVATGTSTFTVVSGTSEPITALAINPNALSLAGGGQTGQLIAMATNGSTGLQEDVTTSSQLKWTSSIPAIATVNSAGLVTGVSPGNTIITAQWTNPDNTVVSATANITVSAVSSTGSLVSLMIIPSSITVGNLQGTGNFLAIGTFSTPPTVRDLTNSVTWISSFPDSFPVSTNNGGTLTASGGIVTAYGTGGATIIAEATGPDGSIQTATATFNCPLILPTPTTAGSCFPGSQATPLKVTLTVYGEGLNTTNWLVTAPSATGTPDVIHCGPGWAANGGTGGSVCTGIYPVGTTITVTAPAQKGVAFGGWTYNCIPTAPINAAGPNSCAIDLSNNSANVPTNVTVGAIFNNQ